MEYLDFKSILAASSVSQQWLALTQTKEIIKKLTFFVQTEEQMECFIKSKRNFINLIFGYNPHNPNHETQTIDDFPILKQFWSTCCNNVQYVCLDGINNLYLAIEGLSQLKNLQTLDFRNSKYFLDIPHLPEISKCTLSISTLLLNADPHYEYMDNDEMEFLLAVTPKLKKLVIFSSKMSPFVMKYLQNPELASSLRHLELRFSTQNEDADHIRRFFLDLIEIKHFNLEFLEYGFPHDTQIQYTHSERVKIEKFLIQQKNLKELKISGSELTEICCKLVFPKLPRLQVARLDVTIYNSDDDTWPISLASKNAFLESFKLFWKLKEVEFQYFTGYEHPIFDSLIEPSVLRSLIIWSTIQTVAGLATLENSLKFLPNLTNLNMTSCVIKDSFLQSIFQNLLSLKTLTLSAQGYQWVRIKMNAGLLSINMYIHFRLLLWTVL